MRLIGWSIIWGSIHVLWFDIRLESYLVLYVMHRCIINREAISKISWNGLIHLIALGVTPGLKIVRRSQQSAERVIQEDCSTWSVPFWRMTTAYGLSVQGDAHHRRQNVLERKDDTILCRLTTNDVVEGGTFGFDEIYRSNIIRR